MRVGNLRQLQRVLALASPAVIVASGLWHSWQEDFALKIVPANATLLVAAGTLGVALFRRSKGLEAAWFNARVTADPSESADEPFDALQAASFWLPLPSCWSRCCN